MYDCEGVVTNDPKMNEIYYKYVQEQMIRALDNATEYLAISDALKSGKPLLSNQIETLKDCMDDFFPEGFDRGEIYDTMKELYFSIICFAVALVFFALFVMSDKPEFKNTIIDNEGLWQRLNLVFMYLPLAITAVIRIGK